MTRRPILVAIVIGLAGLQPAVPVRAAVDVFPTADDTWGTGPYAAAADGSHLYVVGEFTKIGGIRHVGFAAFSGTP